jgi:hypothetical protein
VNIPEPNFTHILSMTNEFGTFEHAQYSSARLEHGFCSDDVARVLIVACREGDASDSMGALVEGSLKFLLRAQDPSGRVRNRRTFRGEWTDQPSNEDAWGRTMWALGTAAVQSTHEHVRRDSLAAFDRGSYTSSTWSRASSFATLGALEISSVTPDHPACQRVIESSAAVRVHKFDDPSWCWAEDRLRYANAVLPEALLGIGVLHDSQQMIDTALRELRWLLDEESQDGYLSVTAVGGRSRGEVARPFDQQPIEVAAMADACLRAWRVTGDEYWARGVRLCVGWFIGDNKLGAVMYNSDDGGGYDGLNKTGPNLNQGAEATLALLSTLQHARLFSASRP